MRVSMVFGTRPVGALKINPRRFTSSGLSSRAKWPLATTRLFIFGICYGALPNRAESVLCQLYASSVDFHRKLTRETQWLVTQFREIRRRISGLDFLHLESDEMRPTLRCLKDRKFYR
jgi:hypothetical protein